jgi:malic enzyme
MFLEEFCIFGCDQKTKESVIEINQLLKQVFGDAILQFLKKPKVEV